MNMFIYFFFAAVGALCSGDQDTNRTETLQGVHRQRDPGDDGSDGQALQNIRLPLPGECSC